jgi:putative methyltransferase
MQALTSCRFANTPTVYVQLLALVTQTLRFLPVIEKLVDNSGLLEVERKLPRSLALVVVHDVTVAGCGVQCGGAPRKLEQRHKSRLAAELIKLKAKARVRETVDLLPEGSRVQDRIPRWARINTLRCSVEKAIQKTQEQGESTGRRA